jgi:hypothetical protein
MLCDGGVLWDVTRSMRLVCSECSDVSSGLSDPSTKTQLYVGQGWSWRSEVMGPYVQC